MKAMAPVLSGPPNLTFSVPLIHSVPCRRTVCKLTHSLEAGGVGFQSSYESEKHVPLFGFDVSTPVRMCLLLRCLENQGLEDEVLPLALTTRGMNSLVTLNSFCVYGSIIWSPVDIPQPL